MNLAFLKMVRRVCLLVALLSCLNVSRASAGPMSLPDLTLNDLIVSWDSLTGDFSAVGTDVAIDYTTDNVTYSHSHATVTLNYKPTTSNFLFSVVDNPWFGDADLGLAGAGVLLQGVVTSFINNDPSFEFIINLTTSQLGQGSLVRALTFTFGGPSQFDIYPEVPPTVPEPGSVALFATGLVGLFLVWRRRAGQNA